MFICSAKTTSSSGNINHTNNNNKNANNFNYMAKKLRSISNNYMVMVVVIELCIIGR